MEPSSIGNILLFIFFVFLSATFLGLKSAFFSLNKSSIEVLSESRKYSDKKIVEVLQKKQRLLITLVVGSILSNAIAVTIVVFTSVGISGYLGINIYAGTLLGIFLYLLIHLAISEVTSKVLGTKSPKRFIKLSIFPFLLFYYLFSPLTLLLDKLSRSLSASFGLDKDKFELSEEELRNIVDVSEEGTGW